MTESPKPVLRPLAQSSAAESLGQAQLLLWPKYESHKIVAAAVIVGIVRGAGGQITLMVKPEDETLPEPFWPTVAGMAKIAEIGGYAVIYEDGFRSLSPAAVFTTGYTRIDPPPPPPSISRLPTPAGD
jgi:hypothetical protein